jgi:hypothetical protein
MGKCEAPFTSTCFAAAAAATLRFYSRRRRAMGGIDNIVGD